jgi:sec-independent protein translocase protein TatB
MFDIGWFELFFVVAVAVVVVGPKDLPKMMRNVGRWTGRARAMADQFRRSFEDMARQSELEEMRTEMMKIQNDTSLAQIKRETDEYLGDVPSDPLASSSATPKAARAGAQTASLDNNPVSDGGAAPSPPAPVNEPAPESADKGVSEMPSVPEVQSRIHRDEP